MSTGTKIEWTDTTWNPVVGCTPVSPGCLNCYAATFAGRGLHERYVGLTMRRKGEGGRTRAVFNGTVRTVPEVLEQPLRWRKPRRVFVNSMSDLFHEDVPDEFIDRVFEVVARCPNHVFQVLTKRPERMADYLRDAHALVPRRSIGHSMIWPNLWLGTSCENQAAAEERIPHLLRCPAAVRFLSCEPLLGEIDLEWALTGVACRECADWGDIDGQPCPHHHGEAYEYRDAALDAAAFALRPTGAGPAVDLTGNAIHWVIVGGESGADARPCDVGWIRSIVAQCGAAGVPVFVKQLGALVHTDAEDCGWGQDWTPLYPRDEMRKTTLLGYRVAMKDPKGGEMAEWPKDLRVREFPEAVRA